MHSVYSHRARTSLAGDKGIVIYDAALKKYSNIKDQGVLKMDMSDFPAEMAGALYVVDGNSIAVESRQVTQVDNETGKSWVFSVGGRADERKMVQKDFVDRNGGPGIIQ